MVRVAPRALSVIVMRAEPAVDERTEMEELLVEEVVHGTVVVLVIKSVTTTLLYAEMMETFPIG